MGDNVKLMYNKFPKLFMLMWVHSEDENPGRGDDISVIYSKIMSNVTHPDLYWMPDEADGFTKEEILKAFAELELPQEPEQIIPTETEPEKEQ